MTLLSSHWYVCARTTFDFQHADGSWSTQQRETYDRGNGATILLYDPTAQRCCSPASSASPSTSTATPTGC